MKEFVSKSFKAHAEQKAAIPFKHYPLADEDTAWDGPKVVADSDIADLMKICSWYDSSKAEEDLTKGDFKLPHHLTKADGYKTVWRGVAAAYAALLGSRGGVDIPETEKNACIKHIESHYREFGKDIPEKSLVADIENAISLLAMDGAVVESTQSGTIIYIES